jgi:glycine/D-amino acid oxidase-like deaminating enzyme
MRTLPDNRVIVGGEDADFVNPARRDSLITQKTLVLKQKFIKLFPEIPLKVEYSWAGTFGETRDGLPYIGTPARMPNVYFALGYGGNGITYSLIAAEIIRDDFRGKQHVARDIFRFGR